MSSREVPSNDKPLPVIYSCSGCSSIAQLANRVAVELDHDGEAEMSCIAGVGGGVKTLVKKAHAAPEIIALDGCQLRCVEACLKQQGLAADHHLVLTDLGIKKSYHQSFQEDEVVQVKAVVRQLIHPAE